MTAPGQDALLAAARLVAAELELDLERGPAHREGEGAAAARALERDPVDALARASRVRARRVMLRGDWWRANAGPLLAFREEDDQAVALLPRGPGRYALVVPGSAAVTLTEALAGKLEPGAYMFLPSFGEQPLTLLAMWRKGWRGTGPDLMRLMTTSLAVGVLALAAPAVSKILIDDVIPHGLSSQVPWIAAALMVFALMAAAVGLMRGLSILRLESRMELNMEAALMDRVLRLPSRFFRGHDAGSLAERVLGIAAIRQALAGTELVAVLGGVFSFASLALIFFYDARLALLGLLLGAVALGAIAAGSLYSLRFLRRIETERGAMSGLLLQVLSGISQLRVAGAESRAFGVCAERFVRLHQLAYQAGLVETAFAVFRLAFPVLCTLLFFAAIDGIAQMAQACRHEQDPLGRRLLRRHDRVRWNTCAILELASSLFIARDVADRARHRAIRRPQGGAHVAAVRPSTGGAIVTRGHCSRRRRPTLSNRGRPEHVRPGGILSSVHRPGEC
ncbi:MAG: ABC transporter transmembrane domain-containing protein [Rubrivivax sp.]